MEKVYKVLKNAGGANITVGVLLIVIGITLGILILFQERHFLEIDVIFYSSLCYQKGCING